MIEQFLFAHPALFQIYIWVSTPFIGLLDGLVFGLVLRAFGWEAALRAMRYFLAFGITLGTVVSIGLLFREYHDNAIGMSILTSADYIHRQVIGAVLAVILAWLSMQFIVTAGKKQEQAA